MEDNENDSFNPDSDVLLPPRKRLLAGLKRQSSESPSQNSPENPVSPFPSSMEVDSRLQNLLKSYKSGPQMSPEELAKTAKTAAKAATKAAEAARAVAVEKAVIAAKAVAAAINALSRVANSSMETGRHSKKNKIKKHVPVEHLYKEQQAVQNSGAEHDLARKLQMAFNSFPRTPKDSPKNIHKRPRHTLEYENHGVSIGMVADKMQEDINCANKEASRSGKSEQVEEIGVESSDGRKRGRGGKQKKLLLSLCSYKDRANPKDGLDLNISDVGNNPVSPMDINADKHAPIEDAPAWKCQDYNVPQCINSNKVMQS